MVSKNPKLTKYSHKTSKAKLAKAETPKINKNIAEIDSQKIKKPVGKAYDPDLDDSYIDIEVEAPIVLLPMRLEIRAMESKSEICNYSGDREDFNSKDEEIRHTTEESLDTEIKNFTSKEYWIRWYPDEINMEIPIKPISTREKEKWQKYEKFFNKKLSNLKKNSESQKKAGSKSKKGKNSKDLGKLAVKPKLNVKDPKFANVGSTVNKKNINFGQSKNILQEKLKMGIEEYEEELSNVEKATNQLIQKYGKEMKYEFGVVRSRQLVKNMILNGYKLTPGGAWDFDVDEDGLDQDDKDGIDRLFENGVPFKGLPDNIFLYTISKTGELTFIYKSSAIQKESIKIDMTNPMKNSWLTNFGKATELGMGAKIKAAHLVKRINEAEWLIALGVDNDADSTDVLEELIRRRNASGSFGFVKQGTPTNNTDNARTDFTQLENDIIKYFAETDKTPPMAPPDKDVMGNNYDAHILQDVLKTNPSTLGETKNSDLKEQRAAEAMAVLIWDACTPLFKHVWMNHYFYKAPKEQREEILKKWEDLRKFFIKSVKGRGNLPIIRINKNPYGILPVFSLDDWEKYATDNSDYISYEKTLDFLQGLLSVFKKRHFDPLTSRIPKIEPNRELNSLEELFDILKTTAVSRELNGRIIKTNEPFHMDYPKSQLNLKPSVTLEQTPGKKKDGKQKKKDERMYKSTPIRCKLTADPTDDPLEYLEEWSQLDLRKLGKSRLLSQFVPSNSTGSKSSVLHRILFNYLEVLTNYTKVTSNTEFKYIFPLKNMRQMRKAAYLLSTQETESLDSLLMEVLDLLFYRLDAWISGLAYERLKASTDKMQRSPKVGGFGWLEKPGEIVENTMKTGVYLQAPSVSQANTAAVLYNASLNRNSAENEPFQIDLSSERVKKGLWYIQGLRQGHLPEELLGCMVERLIHDQQALPSSPVEETDIYKLRKVYPLPLNRPSGELDEESYSTFVETVINGIYFLEDEHLPSVLFTNGQYNPNDPKDKNKKDALNKIKKQVDDIRDAGADLALGESLHQFIGGNKQRTAAWFDFIQGKTSPPDVQFSQSIRQSRNFSTNVMMLIETPESIEKVSEHIRAKASPIVAKFCRDLIGNYESQEIHITKVRWNERGKRDYEVVCDISYNLEQDLDLTAIDFVVGGHGEVLSHVKAKFLTEWREATKNRKASGVFQELPKYGINRGIEDRFTNLGLELKISEDLMGKTKDILVLLTNIEKQSEITTVIPDTTIKMIQDNNLDHVSPIKTIHILLKRAESLLTDYHALQNFFKNIDKKSVIDGKLDAVIKQLRNYGYVRCIAPIPRSIDDLRHFETTRQEIVNWLQFKKDNIARGLNELMAEYIPEFQQSEEETEKEIRPKKKPPRIRRKKKVPKVSKKPGLDTKELKKKKPKLKKFKKQKIATDTSDSGNIYPIKKSGDIVLKSPASKNVKLPYVTGKISHFIAKNGEILKEGKHITLDIPKEQLIPSERWIKENHYINTWCKHLFSEIRSMDWRDQLDYLQSRSFIKKCIEIIKSGVDGKQATVMPPFVLLEDTNDWMAEPINWNIGTNFVETKIQSVSLEKSDLLLYARVRPTVRNLIHLLDNSDFNTVYCDKYDESAASSEDGDMDMKYGDEDFYYVSTHKMPEITSKSFKKEVKYFSCLLIDKWQESASYNDTTSGIAYKYDSPQTEAPNAILMAVHPHIKDELDVDISELQKSTEEKEEETLKKGVYKGKSKFWKFWNWLFKGIVKIIAAILTLLARQVEKGNLEMDEDGKLSLPDGEKDGNEISNADSQKEEKLNYVKWEKDNYRLLAKTIKNSIDLMKIRMVGTEQVLGERQLGKYFPAHLFGFSRNLPENFELFPMESMGVSKAKIDVEMELEGALEDAIPIGNSSNLKGGKD